MKRKQSSTGDEGRGESGGGSDFGIHVAEGKEYTSKLMYTLGEGESEIFSIRFDHEDKHIAAGCGDGTVRVFNLATKKEMFTMKSAVGETSPITCVRWRPLEAAGASKNVLLTVNAQGRVQHWLTTSCKLLHTTAETGMLFCADYTADGSTFGTAGDDKIVGGFVRLRSASMTTRPKS
jgi:WD40 repeat protein